MKLKGYLEHSEQLFLSKPNRRWKCLLGEWSTDDNAPWLKMCLPKFWIGWSRRVACYFVVMGFCMISAWDSRNHPKMSAVRRSWNNVRRCWIFLFVLGSPWRNCTCCSATIPNSPYSNWMYGLQPYLVCIELRI